MLQKFVKTVGGNPHRRQLEQLSEEIEQINALEPEFEKQHGSGHKFFGLKMPVSGKFLQSQ